MQKLKRLRRLVLTEELWCQVQLVRRADEVRHHDDVGYGAYEAEVLALGDAVFDAIQKQSENRAQALPARAAAPAMVVEVRLTPKRRHRA